MAAPDSTDTGNCEDGVLADPNYPQVSGFVNCVFCNTYLGDSNTLMEKAKLLFCFHSVCDSCVSTWQMNELKTCTLCLRPSKKSDLFENKIIQELIEMNVEEMCTNHSDEPAIKYCCHCSAPVCKACVEVTHPMLNSTRDHKMIELSEMTQKSLVSFLCEKHPKESLDLFCVTCKTLVCRDCLLRGAHRGHDYETEKQRITEMCEGLKSEYMAMTGRLRQMKDILLLSDDLVEKKVNDFLKQKSELSSTLDSCCKRVVSEIEKKFNELKSKVDRMVGNDIQDAESIRHGNKLKLQALGHILTVIDTLVHRSSDNNVLYNRGHFLSFFNMMCPEVVPAYLPDNTVRRIYKLDKMEPLFMELSDYLHKLGDVITVLEDTDKNGETVQASSMSPVRLRTADELQSPKAQVSTRKPSPDVQTANSVPESTLPSPSGVRWHTPEPPRPSTSSPASNTQMAIQCCNSGTTKRQTVATCTVTPPVAQLSSASISSAEQTLQISSYVNYSYVASPNARAQHNAEVARMQAMRQHMQHRLQLNPPMHSLQQLQRYPGPPQQSVIQSAANSNNGLQHPMMLSVTRPPPTSGQPVYQRPPPPYDLSYIPGNTHIPYE